MINVSEIKVPIAKPIIGDEEIENVVEVLKSGMIAQGPKVEEFEQKFAEWVGADYGIAVNSGTAALHVALLSCGIGKGDEVITTPFTFIASGNSILYTGAKPVFAGAFAKPGLIPIVTYYYLDTDGCHVATFVNDIQVEDENPEEEIQLEEGTIEGDGMGGAEEISVTEERPDVLPIKRIPIFPVLGERTWTESDNIIYRGLIAKGKTVQRIVTGTGRFSPRSYLSRAAANSSSGHRAFSGRMPSIWGPFSPR